MFSIWLHIQVLITSLQTVPLCCDMNILLHCSFQSFRLSLKLSLNDIARSGPIVQFSPVEDRSFVMYTNQRIEKRPTKVVFIDLSVSETMPPSRTQVSPRCNNSILEYADLEKVTVFPRMVIYWRMNFRQKVQNFNCNLLKLFAANLQILWKPIDNFFFVILTAILPQS